MSKKLTLCILFLFAVCLLSAQVPAGVYVAEEDTEKAVRHEIKLTADYLIFNTYGTSPAEFIRSIGGFYTVKGDSLQVKLEFNSNYETDGLKEFNIQYKLQAGELLAEIDGNLGYFTKIPATEQALDGHWLFATRGPDQGQERRGDDNPRKTLKALSDGHFQWIAYNTETFDFRGTGGGRYDAKEGVYTEKINFFSRDSSRVGAELIFDYELREEDWHHKGKNSKGEPMYEIWSKR